MKEKEEEKAKWIGKAVVTEQGVQGVFKGLFVH